LSVAVIINPISGRRGTDTARRRAELVSDVLTATGQAGDIFVTERRGHARELAAAALSRGVGLIAVWGGDGTINEVASSLLTGDAALGIIPGGSGNSLARQLGLKTRPEQALRAALQGQRRRIDAGRLDGRLFFSIAGIGFDAHVAGCFDRDTSGRRGFSTYLRLAARELLRYSCQTYAVDWGEGRSTRRAFLVTFANSGQFGNGAVVAPDARLDDGRLDLVIYEERSRLGTVCAAPRLFGGRVTGVRGLSIRQVERVTVESDAPMLYHIDGEPLVGGTRLEAAVLPGVLTVQC
jgi:YegS/Rv2252/BmrU family lipid kinase